MPLRLFAAVTVATSFAALLAPAPSEAQGAGGRLLTGVVIAQSGQMPLAHSMVSLQPVARQTFTDDAGRFAFTGLPAGGYRLRVTHLGFSPTEMAVTISGDSEPARVRIELAAVQVRLATVKVVANAPCVKPGAPDAVNDHDLFLIFEQLEQNAQEYRLLADSFPYAYRQERTYFTVRGDSAIEDIQHDTAMLRSNKPEWTYHPGEIVTTDFITRQRFIHLPTLSDFASNLFVKNHCFLYGGEEHTAAGDAIRIDFRAARRIHSADVDGTIFLDAKSYQIRRAELRLSLIPSSLRKVAAVNVTTLFREVEPSVLVFSEVHGVTTMVPSRDLLDDMFAIEDHVLLDFGFLGANPQHPDQKP